MEAVAPGHSRAAHVTHSSRFAVRSSKSTVLDPPVAPEAHLDPRCEEILALFHDAPSSGYAGSSELRGFVSLGSRNRSVHASRRLRCCRRHELGELRCLCGIGARGSNETDQS